MGKNNVIIINKRFSFEKCVSRRCEWWLEDTITWSCNEFQFPAHR